GAYSHKLKCRLTKVAPIEELRIGEALVAVDDGLSIGVEPSCAPREFKRRECYFHDVPPGQYPAADALDCRPLGRAAALQRIVEPTTTRVSTCCRANQNRPTSKPAGSPA